MRTIGPRASAAFVLGVAMVTVLSAPAGAPAAAATTAPTWVQGAVFGTGAQVASTTVRLAGAIGSGDLLVGWFSQFAASGTVQVSDPINGAWTRGPASTPFGSSGDNALFYVQNASASATGVTVTVSAGTATYLQGTVAEYSGVATSAALDAMAVGRNTSTSVSVGPTASVAAGDLVFSALVTGGSPGSVTPGSDAGVAFTRRASTSSGSAYEQDVLSGPVGAQTGAATLATSTKWVAVVAAFRPAGAAPPQPPTAPNGLATSGVTASRVGLVWNAATSNVPVTGYSVLRDGAVVGTTNTTSFADTTVAASTTYSYTVVATNSAGQNSSPSAPLSVTTSAAPPGAPTGLVASGVTSAQVGLSWTAPTTGSPATGYGVYRNGTLLGAPTTTTWTDTTVAPGTTYSYTVTATGGGQTSAPSTPLTVTTPSGSVACSTANLVSAVAAANSTSGGGTVVLTAGCTYVLTTTASASDGGEGLPVITGNVTVTGNGATVTRSTASGTPSFRILDVASGGRLTIDGVAMSNGVASDGKNGGGAIYNHGTLVVTNCTFTGNSNPATTGTSGGAIQNGGTATISGSVFTGNSAMEGGALFNQASLTVHTSTFTNNVANVYGGGALLNAFGTMTVDSSTFVGNSGPGGGVLDNDTTVNISNSTMVGNTGGSHGGGAIQNFGTVTITTSTLSGNTSPYGADIYNYGSSVTTVSQSLVVAGNGGNCGGTPITDGGYNVDSGTTCGFSTSNHSQPATDPMLQPLADNGGPTRTMALTPGSPAVDVIPAAASGCTGTTDQRGAPRPGGVACDVGAYELAPPAGDTRPPSTPTGLTSTSSVAGSVGLSWSPSTDDVGVAAYTVYRNGTAVGTAPGNRTSWTDTTAVANTTYRYTVDAVDSSGNHSAPSTPVDVTTTPAPAPVPTWRGGGAVSTGTRVTSVTVTLSGPVVAGDLLVGWFGAYDGAGQVTVSDAVDGAWTRSAASTTFGSGTGDIALFSVTATAAANSLTVTLTVPTATYLEAAVADYSGVATTAPLGQTAVARGTGTSGTASTSGPTASGDLVFSALLTGGSPGAVSAAPLRLRNSTGSGSAADADAVASSSGPQTGSWTWSTATDWYVVTAVFHAAPAP